MYGTGSDVEVRSFCYIWLYPHWYKSEPWRWGRGEWTSYGRPDVSAAVHKGSESEVMTVHETHACSLLLTHCRANRHSDLSSTLHVTSCGASEWGVDVGTDAVSNINVTFKGTRVFTGESLNTRNCADPSGFVKIKVFYEFSTQVFKNVTHTQNLVINLVSI